MTLGPKIIPARTKKHVQVQKKVPRSKKHASPFEEDLQRYIFRGRRGIRDMFMFIRDVRRSGRWFPEMGCILDLQVCWDDFAWQVQHFVWPGLTFSWQAQYFRQVEWKNRKTHWHEAVSSALNFPFLKGVSQNCFVFDVVNVEKWGSLPELFRFWRCQVQKLRKSRRIASFSSLQLNRQTDRQAGREAGRQTDRQRDRETEREIDRQTDRQIGR